MKNNLTRHALGTVGTAGLAALGVAALLPSKAAAAEYPKLKHAKEALNAARDELKKADYDFRGHKAEALEAINPPSTRSRPDRRPVNSGTPAPEIHRRLPGPSGFTSTALQRLYQPRVRQQFRQGVFRPVLHHLVRPDAPTISSTRLFEVGRSGP